MNMSTNEWLIYETTFFMNNVHLFRGEKVEVDLVGNLVLSDVRGIAEVFPAGTWQRCVRNSPQALNDAETWVTCNFW